MFEEMTSALPLESHPWVWALGISVIFRYYNYIAFLIIIEVSCSTAHYIYLSCCFRNRTFSAMSKPFQYCISFYVCWRLVGHIVLHKELLFTYIMLKYGIKGKYKVGMVVFKTEHRVAIHQLMALLQWISFWILSPNDLVYFFSLWLLISNPTYGERHPIRYIVMW